MTDQRTPRVAVPEATQKARSGWSNRPLTVFPVPWSIDALLRYGIERDIFLVFMVMGVIAAFRYIITNMAVCMVQIPMVMPMLVFYFFVFM